MKSLVTVLLALIGLLPRLDLSVSPPLAFSYYRSITVDHTKVPSTQTDFPVLVAGTYTDLKTAGNGGHVQNASGYDVGFYTNSDCSTGKMKWETELHTATTGVVVYWVKVASLSSSADTVFYLCYGDSGISSDQSDKTNVWDSNFKGVWHLSDNAASTVILDSTANAANGTNQANTNGKTTAGKIGPALQYTRASSDYTTISDQVFAGDFTWELWAYIDDATPSEQDVGFILPAGDTNWYAKKYRVYFAAADLVVGATDTATTTWTKLVITRSGSSLVLYFNGTSDGSGSNAASITVSGWGAAIGVKYNGRFDEMRTSNSARSADRITVDYNNQSSPSTFYTLGSEQSGGGGATSFVPGIINVPIIIRRRHVVIDLPFVPYKRAA